ncbi:MAG: NAD-dependent epimerase/dehydratase family protein, partial [Rhodospirillaceae bacterium]
RLDPQWRMFSDMIVQAAYWMRQRGKKTVLGGMCPTDPNWIRTVGDAGALENIDAISLHGFPGTWTHGEAAWIHQVEDVRAVLPAAARDVQIWITEGGYSTWRHDERGQIEVLLDLLDAPVERVYWYAWQDLHPSLASQEGFHVDERHYHFGLTRTDGSPKLLGRLLAKGGIPEVRRVAAMADGAPFVRHDRPVTLITGGAGFLGANLADSLAADGRTVRIFDTLSRPGVEDNLAWLRDRHGDRIEAVCGDVRDRWAVRDVIADAETVFHLAAQVAVTTSVTDPRLDFDINLGGSLNVLEAARLRTTKPRLVFASTNKVYGALSDVAVEEGERAFRPVDQALHRHGVGETQPLDLHSPYGCSKGAADQYVLDHARIYGIPAVVFRMSCLYGPRQFGTEDQGWVAHFLISVLNGRPITLFGNGKQVRDVLFVDDAVAAWRLAETHMDRLSGQAFNIGGGPGNAVSLLDTLDEIGRLTGQAAAVSFSDWRPGDQPWYVSDTRAFQALTGWRPEVAPAEGMARLRDWLTGAADAVISPPRRIAV